MVSNSASSPARWPSVRGRPRLVAHLPLPSMTQATWTGIRWGSSPSRSTFVTVSPCHAPYPALPANTWGRLSSPHRYPRAVTTDEVAAALDRVVGGLPGGGDSRPGQCQMAAAVARAIAERRHLIVTAQTGTGKSLAYLVPALLSGSRVVVATATKALQDQLA